MIDTTQLTQLISAFRVETEKESISPETVGALLQNITDLLANATSTTEQQIFENWKAILSQLNLVESVQQGANNVEHVNIAMTLRDLANGGRTGANFAIAPATAQSAGVMTAAQAQMLASLNEAVSALELAAVHVANKNAEQDARLDIIQGGHSVITAIEQGTKNTVKVLFNIRKQNLATGEEYNKANNKEIAAATNEYAGVMTKAHVQALEKAATDIGNLRQHVDLLRQPQLYVTGVYNRPESKSQVCLGVEFTDIWTGDLIEAGDDIIIPAANTQRAGVMTAQHAKRLDSAEQEIQNLKNSPSSGSSKSMFPISIEISDENGGNRLRVLGAKPLLDRGYYPYLFRLTKKRNMNRHDDRHSEVRKGWNRVGQTKGVIKVSNDGYVTISIAALKHTEIDISAEEENYQPQARWFVNDRVKSGKRIASFGRIQVKLQYLDENHELKVHKVRLPFGIAFSKQAPTAREKFDMSQLVTDIATFHVATVPYDHGTQYRWIFER